MNLKSAGCSCDCCRVPVGFYLLVRGAEPRYNNMGTLSPHLTLLAMALFRFDSVCFVPPGPLWFVFACFSVFSPYPEGTERTRCVSWGYMCPLTGFIIRSITVLYSFLHKISTLLRLFGAFLNWESL